MSLFAVDSEKCKRDGICIAECPIGLIELKDKKSVPVPIDGADEMCVNCGHCVAVCPHGAISLATMKPEDCPPVKKEMLLSPEHVEHFLRARRSVRTYQDKEIEREKLAKLLDISRYAPTAKNSQQVRWLVINSREGVRDMAGITVDFLRYLIKENHPAAAAYRLADIVSAWEAGLDRLSRCAHGLVIVHAPKDYVMAQVDSAIALTFLDLAAPSFGLGTCWAGFLMIAASQWPPLQQALSLPDGHACFGAMMVGYPKYRYHRIPQRNDAVVEWL